MKLKQVVIAVSALAVVALSLFPGGQPPPAYARSYKIISNAINDTITPMCPLDTGDPAIGVAGLAFTAESTAIFNVGDYPNVGLFLRVIPAGGDTTTAIRLAIGVRAHTDLTGDSSSTFPWHVWVAAATAAIPDSTNNKFSTSGPPAGEGCGVWGGEFLCTLGDPTRGRGNMKTNQFFGAPNGIYIPLISRTGVKFSAPYMSIRIRVLSGANKPKVTAHVGLVQ